MSATGPHKNNFIISDLVLGDTFEEWFVVTNTKIIDKLNRLKVYTATGNEGITANTNDAGLLTIGLETIIPSDHTFTGNITFNGDTTTVNSFDLNVDDYNLVLGATGPGGSTMGDNDAKVGATLGGGGIIIRGSSGDKSILWKYPRDTFVVSDHIGLSGGRAIGSINNNLGLRDMHTKGVSAGLQFGFTASTGVTGATTQMGGTAGTGGSRDLLVHYITEHGVAGTTHEIARVNSDAFVEIVNGVNRKRITQTAHGFTFGMVVRRDFDTATDKFVLAKADTKQNAEVVGVISRIVDANTFDVTFSGEVVAKPGETWSHALTAGLTDLSPGHAYFLSHTSEGKLSLTPVTTPGFIRKPVITALDDNRALVTNYIGHEVASEDVLAAAGASNRKLIEQVNDFEVGDVLRFDQTQKYGFSAGTEFRGITYEHGTYRKAQANSEVEAESVGIVSEVDVSGDVKKFYMTTGGFFTMPSSYGLTAGQVYFLSANSAGTTAAQSLTTISPKTVGMVRKPLLVTASNTEAYFLNYIGTTITDENSTDTLTPLVGKTFFPVSTREQLISIENAATEWPLDGSGFSHGAIALDGNLVTHPDLYDQNSTFSLWESSSTQGVPTNATHAVLTVNFNLKFVTGDTHPIYFDAFNIGTFTSNSWKTSANRRGTLLGSGGDRSHVEMQVIVPINRNSTGSHIMYAVDRSAVNGPFNHSIHLEGFFVEDSEVLVPNPSGTFRNKIINGNFDFWQRERGIGGTGDTRTDTNFYTADRWARNHSTGTPSNFSLQRGTFDFAQTDVPHYPQYFMRHSGQLTGSTGSTSFVVLEQKIEDVRTLAGKNATLSFYAKGTKAGKIHVALKQDFGSGGNNGRGGTTLFGSVMGADIGTGWNRYTTTLEVAALGGTASAGTGHNLSLQFYTYAPDALGVGNTTHIDYDGVLEIAQVQLEENTKATSFDIKEPSVELERCQRYFQIADGGWNGRVEAASTGTYGTYTNFSVPMRVTPTVVGATDVLNSSFAAASADDMTNGYGGAAILTNRGFMPSRDYTASGIGDRAVLATYEFDAEL